MDHAPKRHADGRGTRFEEARQFGGRLIVRGRFEEEVTRHVDAVRPLTRGRENGRGNGEQQRGRATRRLFVEGPKQVERKNFGMFFPFLVVAAISSMPENLRVQPVTKITEHTSWQRGKRGGRIGAGGGEDGKGLDGNIGDAALTGERMCACCEKERVDDEVGIVTGRERVARDIHRDRVDVVADRASHLDGIISRGGKCFADLLGIASKRGERDTIRRDKFREAMRRGKFDVMAVLLQSER